MTNRFTTSVARSKLISPSEVFDEVLFGNDAADDENRYALHSYFVDNPEFRSFESSDIAFSVVRGRKGMGKSAAVFNLSFLKHQDQNSIIAEEFGSSLIAPSMFDVTGPNELVSIWHEAIAASLCAAISKKISLP